MYQDLIEFWFSEEASKHWFKSTKTFDQALLDTYAGTWVEAKQGKLDHWQQSAAGSLALIIVLDQLPLNMFRGQAKSFSTEAQSREVARAAITKGFDQELPANQISHRSECGACGRYLTTSPADASVRWRAITLLSDFG